MDARTSITDCASSIRALVARRDYAEAVRRFESLNAALPAHQRDEIAAKLARQGGRDTVKALVKALARAPCYYCDHGRMTCDLCGGANTYAANGRFCETCGGVGRTPCSFCGGSGFLAPDRVPHNLDDAVAGRRLHWAAKALREVTGRSAKLKRSDRSPGMLREMLRLFGAVERVAAVLDETDPPANAPANAPAYAPADADAGRQRARTRPPSDAKILKQCRRLTRRYHNALAQAIATFCRAQADRESADPQRQLVWNRQADFYEKVSGWNGTAAGCWG